MYLAAVLVLGLLITAGCGPQTETSQCFAMGTVCSQTVAGPEEWLAEGEQMLFAMDARYSWRRTDSEISRINAHAGEFVEVSRETFDLVAKAREMAERTGGAFDPTIGVLSKEWNFVEDPKVPSAQVIENGLAYIDYRQIELDAAGCRVKIAPGQFLDLGGIAKGAAADALAAYYRAQGAESGILNLGGNVYVLGTQPDGTLYRVGLRDPEGAANDVYGSIAVRDKTVVGSGAYERNFTENGETYHHILDAETGWPAESDLLSACIVADDSTLADALSTAVFVLGSEKGMALVREMEGVDAILIRKDNTILASDGFAEKYALQLTKGKPYTL